MRIVYLNKDAYEIEPTNGETGFSISSITPPSENVYVISVFQKIKINGVELPIDAQAGVTLYRHLLKLYDIANKLEDLKVIFYAPLSVDKLVQLYPRNYVLKLLPFIEYDYETDFKALVEAKIQKYESTGWPLFNNAAENLLAGWSLSDMGKVDLHEKKVLIIDDEQNLWKKTYQEIVNKPENLLFIDKHKNIESYKNEIRSSPDSFIETVKHQVSDGVDFIFSDFYLTEHHDVNEWKTGGKIAQVSGFKVFEELRQVFPATPYVFHTTSNKASIYKVFDSYGVDDWLVKDIRHDADANALKENFGELKASFEGFLGSLLYEEMVNISHELKKLIKDKKVLAKEFRSGKIGRLFISNFDLIHEILTYSWLGNRRLLNKEVIFESFINNKGESNYEPYASSGICTNLGKILEVLQLSNSKEHYHDSLHKFLFEFRHVSAHGKNVIYFSPLDSIIYCKILFHYLKNNNLLLSGYNSEFHKKELKSDGKFRDFYPYSQMWAYLHLFNHMDEINFKNLRYLIETRIRKLLEQIKSSHRETANFKNILKHTAALKSIHMIDFNLLDSESMKLSNLHLTKVESKLYLTV